MTISKGGEMSPELAALGKRRVPFAAVVLGYGGWGMVVALANL